MIELKWRPLILAAIAALLSQRAVSAPTIQQVSGPIDHKASITIAGSGFGSKATPSPVVWDDASGTNISAKWDGAWPDNNSAYNTAYRSPQRNISPPHGRVNRYIAGAHAQNSGYNAGYNVVFFKNLQKPSHIYASWYQRADDAWVFGGDNNYKTFAYSVCCSPYEMPNNWYTAYGPPVPGNRTQIPQWLFTDDGSSLMNPDINGHNAWWTSGVNPMAGEWSKVEIAVKITNQNDGYIKVWENGRLKMDYLGPTDKYPGTSRTIGVGGYARMSNQPNNWRYWADVYLDTTLSRVALANNANLNQATIVENQIPSSWNAGSIAVNVNLGRFNAGQTAYLFVVDSTGVANSTGFRVTVGGTSVQPNPPVALSIQ